jgi:hypothetical protein
MNVHLHARKLGTHGAEAWPIGREDTGYRPILEKVVVESEHPDGHGVVRLSPDQALYVHSRLSTIAMAFLHGCTACVEHLGVDRLPDDHLQQLSRCGAKVWPISHNGADRPPGLEQVVVESEHPDGPGLVHLSPDQACYIHNRLTHITLAFLHENVWGGEDARAQ